MFSVGLENGTEGRSQAWILGHPGCYAYGVDGAAALAAVPQAIQDYCEWIASHTSQSWLANICKGSYEYRLDETWECYSISEDYELAQEGYEVNAWFRHDWKPLSDLDIQQGLMLLRWGRDELMTMLADISTATLERNYPNERWSISGILKHIAGAEWWYMDRLGLAFPRQHVPDKPMQRLELVRSRLIETLPGLVGSTQVVGVSGEIWSPRKLLRRVVWHESDHIDHIRKLL